MQIRIQTGKHTQTIQCLRAFYDAEAKRTRQKLVCSFAANKKPTDAEIVELTTEERAELSTFMQERDSKQTESMKKYYVRSISRSVEENAKALDAAPGELSAEQAVAIEAAIKMLQKSLKKAIRTNAKAEKSTIAEHTKPS